MPRKDRTPTEIIIQAKSRQHRQDVARIRELEAELAAMTTDRDEWRSLVAATKDLRELLTAVVAQLKTDHRKQAIERERTQAILGDRRAVTRVR